MVKDRILQFIDYKHLSVSRFEVAVGLSNGAVSKTTDRIRPRTLESISRAFPDLNIDWLLTGEGEMLKQQGNATMVGGVYTVGQRDDEVVMVDFIPLAAHASFVESLDGSVVEFDRMPIVPFSEAERRDAASYKIFEVSGDSMQPSLTDGAFILVKEIPENQWHYAEGVVVAVYSEFVVVKRVAANRLLTDNCLVLSSDNPRYGDMTVPLSDLRALYKAKRIISSKII